MGGGENPTYSLIFSEMFLFLYTLGQNVWGLTHDNTHSSENMRYANTHGLEVKKFTQDVNAIIRCYACTIVAPNYLCIC